jgi:hypothetical protein
MGYIGKIGSSKFRKSEGPGTIIRESVPDKTANHREGVKESGNGKEEVSHSGTKPRSRTPVKLPPPVRVPAPPVQPDAARY